MRSRSLRMLYLTSSDALRDKASCKRNQAALSFERSIRGAAVHRKALTLGILMLG